MGLLRELAKKYRTISIIGMAKNAGKTTALNYLIEEAYDEGIRLGITSTGRDGETVDLVTETEKPKVYLYEDTLVSVPEKLFPLSEAALEIIATSNYTTPFGKLYLTSVQVGGYVQIAGPLASSDTRNLCEKMLEEGAELVLIDGAIDRKSVANPESSDAVILSTGAVISRDIKKVVRDTAHVVEIYNLACLEDSPLKSLIEEHLHEERILMVSTDENMDLTPMSKEQLRAHALDLKTGLGSGRYINDAIMENVRWVYIPGALTENMIGDIDSEKFKHTEFILKDPTKIFIDAITWKQLKKRGLKVSVLKNIRVSAVTVNPFAPQGYSFDSRVLCRELQNVLEDIPVIDVRG